VVVLLAGAARSSAELPEPQVQQASLARELQPRASRVARLEPQRAVELALPEVALVSLRVARSPASLPPAEALRVAAELPPFLSAG